ncbi:4Fe-4S dicluster domain-containing protein [Pseudodesulfovibrio tunisiensis]|uniref:4Fe-4S dicluster domain-containing protein n=1 Tax=Pseudodesulfovibrio tunisiensis TaxID=463192 RepID=UPI001FB37F8C|nr:4Fe-4S dicluster domain-containing protein [Pseudodesulfovibrio tunisiensis]
MTQVAKEAWSPGGAEYDAVLSELRDMVQACMQCGTCTASCPNGAFMDITPRQMWRMVQFGMIDEILDSRTYWYCSSCYTCTMRCPRGLKLTSAMAALKRLAQLSDGAGRRNGAFYSSFMDNVETYGRTQETMLMQNYFLRRRDPMLPLKFLPLGLRMLGKGKLHPPKGDCKGRLGPMFARAREMEGRS